MKKLISIVLIAVFMLCAFAFADETYMGDMQVVNCKEWVSLRAEPTTESDRLNKIPLGSVVTDCVIYDDGWVYGSYFGQYGYISGDYLAPYEVNAMSDMLYGEKDGFIVIGKHDYKNGGEIYSIEAFDASGAVVWKYDALCSYSTELTMVDAFIAGTDEKPLVMAYSAETGLTALDFFTGETVWTISDEEQSLGGSICYGVDTDGTIYIGGYYGPDPLAISAEGEILWNTDFKGIYYWLHTIEVYDEHLICYFDMDDTTYEPVTVMLAKNGDFMGLVYQNG